MQKKKYNKDKKKKKQKKNRWNSGFFSVTKCIKESWTDIILNWQIFNKESGCINFDASEMQWQI